MDYDGGEQCGRNDSLSWLKGNSSGVGGTKPVEGPGAEPGGLDLTLAAILKLAVVDDDNAGVPEQE